MKKYTLAQLNESKICPQLCPQLWFGGVIKSSGEYGICCEITGMLPSEFNISSIPLVDSLTSDRYVKMRQEMMSDLEPKECWRCFEREKLGVKSLRNNLNEFYIKNNKIFDDEYIELQNVEIVFGNLCQLSCVMCHPNRSKKMSKPFEYIVNNDFRDSYKLNNHVQQKIIYLNSDWVEDKTIWDKILPQMLTAKRIFLNGGEPLLAKYHNYFLKYLIDNNVSKNIELIYSTNFLLLSQEHLDYWSEFEQVNITISIDDIYERNHFIRYPSNWEKLESNIRLIYKQKFEENKLKNVNFFIWCAVNILNFFYIRDFLNYFKTHFSKLPIQGLRGIQTPAFLNPNIIPYKIRQKYNEQVSNFLESNNFNTHLKSDMLFFSKEEDDIGLLLDGIRYMEMMAEFYNVNIHTLFDTAFTEFNNIRTNNV